MVSIVRRENDDPDVIANTIRAHITALAQAHSITQNAASHKSIALRDLLLAVMEPYSRNHTVAFKGSDIDVSTDVVTPLGLILYEMATNASKYGAFSASTGQVDVAWSVLPLEDNSKEIVLEWNESGGPAVEVPEDLNSGFGSRLLNVSTSQLGGKLETDWNANGVRHTLSFPLRVQD